MIAVATLITMLTLVTTVTDFPLLLWLCEMQQTGFAVRTFLIIFNSKHNSNLVKGKGKVNPRIGHEVLERE